MRFTSLLAASLLTVALGSSIAGAQCGSWQQLSTLGYAGNENYPRTLAVDSTNGIVYASTSCHCGYHDFIVPQVYVWTGTYWGDISPILDAGEAGDIAVFDTGSGPVLHAWYSSAFGGYYFSKFVSGRWINATALPPGQVGTAIVFDDGSGPTYYVTRAAGEIARWTGTSWVSITSGGGANGAINALAVHDDGTGKALYAAGAFTSIGGVVANGVARFDGVTWHALGAGTASPVGGGMRVNVLRSIQDASGHALYAAGEFELADGAPANGVARWNGASWSGLGSALPASSALITGLEWFDDGGGNGAAIVVKDTSVPPTLQRFDGSTWSPLPPASGLTQSGTAMTQVPLPGATGVSLVSTVLAPGNDLTFAAFNGCAQTGTIACLGDGSIAPCPCGNNSASADRSGCLNSFGTGGALRAHGDPTLSHDTLVLDGSGMNNASVLYFQGGSFHTPNPFGDGVKCVGGPFVRLATKMNVSGSSNYPVGTDPSVSIKGLIAGPSTRHYQARYRNSQSFCTPDTFNYTNSVTIVWQS